MKKRILILLMLLMLLVSPALAHDVDIDVLTEGLELYVLPDDNKVDTIYRPIGQKYKAENDAGYGKLFLDYLEMPNEDAVFLRITAALEMYTYHDLPEMTLVVGDTAWTFVCDLRINEYDGTYYEDFYACLTDESLPIIREIIRADGAVQLRLGGEEPFVLDFCIDPAFAADLFDRYVDAGGSRQKLSRFRQLWPAIILKK